MYVVSISDKNVARNEGGTSDFLSVGRGIKEEVKSAHLITYTTSTFCSFWKPFMDFKNFN